MQSRRKTRKTNAPAQPVGNSSRSVAGAINGCGCACHRVGIFGLMCCPCTKKDLDELVNGKRTEPVSPPISGGASTGEQPPECSFCLLPDVYSPAMLHPDHPGVQEVWLHQLISDDSDFRVCTAARPPEPSAPKVEPQVEEIAREIREHIQDDLDASGGRPVILKTSTADIAQLLRKHLAGAPTSKS
jgi:hypothetical protein